MLIHYKTKLYNNNNAAYANVIFTIGPKLEINGGLRTEQTLREIKYRFTTDAANAKFRKIEKNKTELLPSLNAKYVINEKSNIRYAASKTLTRPVSIESISSKSGVRFENGP